MKGTQKITQILQRYAETVLGDFVRTVGCGVAYN